MFDKSHLLEPRYIEQIRIAENHLKTKKSKINGSPIPKPRVDFLIKTGAECPICAITFKAGNHNTEHIFPSGLGGVNQLHNKIQMCVQCNQARNQVLQLMGHPPWHKTYPDKFNLVKQILMWCLITIEDGIGAGEQIPNIHKEFMKIRTGGEDFPNRPAKAFGPASTWAIGDEPNFLHNHSSYTKPTPIPTGSFSLRVLALKALDRFFGYEPTVKPPKNVKLADNIAKNPQSKEAHTERSISSDKSAKRLPKDADAEGLVGAIIGLIGEDEVTGHTLARRVRKMQEDNALMETGTSSFLKYYGFPKNFGLVNALRACANPKIIVDGDETEQKIRIQLEPKSDTTPTSFPQITHFNTASGASYALPKHPQQFTECMVAYSSNQTSLNSRQEIFDILYPILGGAKRTNALISKIAIILLPDDKSHRDQKDWGNTRLVESPLQLAEQIRTLLLNRELNSIYPNDLTSYINEYFDIVKAILQKSSSDVGA